MKTFVTFLTFFVVWGGICSFLGYKYAKGNIEPITITKYETQWKDKVVYRNYEDLPVEVIKQKLKCYDQEEFFLAFDPIKDNEYRITGNLCEREAYKDIKIEASTSGNWKLYAGIGVAGLATGFAIYHFGR